MIIAGIIVGLLVLTLVVVLHELGHALAARKFGVGVKEFGIGFPPLAFGKKRKKSFLGKNVLYSVNWLPLGGFVRLQGEHDDDKEKGDYGNARLWQKAVILLAGVGMNWLTAIVILTGLALVGVPKVVENQFSYGMDTHRSDVAIVRVAENSPAAGAGLHQGDTIQSINGTAITSLAQLNASLRDNQGKEVQLFVTRKDRTQGTVVVRLLDGSDQSKGRLGAGLAQNETYKVSNALYAPVAGVGMTWQFTQLTFAGVGETLAAFGTGLVNKIIPTQEAQETANQNLAQAGGNVAGPVGLVGQIMPAILELGVPYVLLMTALISVALAVMNSLPIPALDGGRLYLTIWFRKVLKKPLTAEKEERINGTGFLVLMLLFVLITVSDIMKFF